MKPLLFSLCLLAAAAAGCRKTKPLVVPNGNYTVEYGKSWPIYSSPPSGQGENGWYPEGTRDIDDGTIRCTAYLGGKFDETDMWTEKGETCHAEPKDRIPPDTLNPQPSPQYQYPSGDVK